MFKAEFPGDEIAAYICDPTLHPPGTSFIWQLLPALFDRTWEVYCWRAVRDSIGKAAELGLIKITNIQAILDFAAAPRSIKLRRPDGKIERVKNRERIQLIKIILESLARSKVLKVADLGRPFLSALFSKLASLNSSYLTSDAVGALWELLPYAGLHDAPVASRLIVRSLRDRCREQSDRSIGEKISQQLQGVDDAILRSAILHTTAQLVEDTRGQSTSAYRYLFYHWMGLLETLGSTRSSIHLTKEDWGIFKSNTVESDIDRCLLLFAWTSLHLSRHRRHSDLISDRLQAHDVLGKTILSIPDFIPEGFIDRAFPALNNLPLPNKEDLLRDLTVIAEHAGALSGSEEAAPSNIQGPSIRDLLLPLDDNSYGDIRRQYSEALAELSECLLQNPQAFQSLSRRLIWKSSTSFTILSRILDNNTPFKLALSQTAQHNKVLGEQLQPHNHAPSTHDMPQASGGRVTPGMESPRTMLAVLNHLAISCATSPVISPREALRKVYWCYHLLHRYGAPIEPSLTKALWHAGVARYGEHGYGEFGTAKTLLKWVLWQIKMAEGEHVARRLLWSPAFRTQRRLEMDGLAKVDEDVASLDRVSNGYDISTQIAASLDSLQELDQPERAVLLAETSRAIGDDSGEPRTKKEASVLSDLGVWQKIRHVKTEPYASPFWYEKSARKELWEKAQAAKAKREDRASKSGQDAR